MKTAKFQVTAFGVEYKNKACGYLVDLETDSLYGDFSNAIFKVFRYSYSYLDGIIKFTVKENKEKVSVTYKLKDMPEDTKEEVNQVINEALAPIKEKYPQFEFNER